MQMPLDQLTPSAQATLRSLTVDFFTAEVTTALQEARVRSILLKGPAVALWLYETGAARAYTDCDLLVSPTDLLGAEEVLKRLGFAKRLEDSDTVGWRQAGVEWRRERDGASVDLHRTIAGVGVDGESLWRELSQATQTLTVGGVRIEVTRPACRALQVALHAAVHGRGAPQQISDLDRALEVLEEGVWQEAASIARRLRATSAFQTGLRLLPAGELLADRLGLPVGSSRDIALLAATPPPGALSWERISQAHGWRARAFFLGRKIVPTRNQMLVWSSLAHRGRSGLIAAYLWRPVWVLLRAMPAFIAWRRVARDHKASRNRSASTRRQERRDL